MKANEHIDAIDEEGVCLISEKIEKKKSLNNLHSDPGLCCGFLFIKFKWQNFLMHFSISNYMHGYNPQA